MSARIEPLPLPKNLRHQADEHPDWVGALPGVVHALTARWSLDLGSPFEPGGETAWVAPALRRPDGRELVLKVLCPHDEARHEAEGLKVWAGEGAVGILDAWQGDGAWALLLERCVPGTTLRERPEEEQDRVVASLLPRLWRPAPGPPFRPLEAMCAFWAAGFERALAAGARSPGDGALVRDGLAAWRELPRSAPRRMLLWTDLHAGNILAAKRAPWLAIDPKPYEGDPTYDALQHMLNCEARLLADPRALTDRMAALLDLERARLGLWLFARAVIESPHRPALASVARAMAP
jgi:streptomycin 6-kinase